MFQNIKTTNCRGKYLIILTTLCSIAYGCEGCLQTRESKTKIELTDDEIKMEKHLSSEYSCDVHLGHDEEVITGNRHDGKFKIGFDFSSVRSSTEKNLCQKDSVYLDSVSKVIAKRIFSILNHKKNYNIISINYSTEKKYDEKMSSIDCSKEFEIPINDLN